MRLYHYDKDVYGYRTPRPFALPDYSPSELANRVQNANLLQLVQAFREYGHRKAHLDPLGLLSEESVPELDPARYGIPETGTRFCLDGILHVGQSNDPNISRESASIERILAHLKASYSSRIGFEFCHIPCPSEQRWFAQYIESYQKKQFSDQERLRIYQLLTKSEVFDRFMAKKFPNVKRYGLEGAESMMIVLDTLLSDASKAGIVDAIICMPHRGRLNLLTDILRFPPAALFHKVKGNSEIPDNLPAIGDVLSHIGTSVDLDYQGEDPIHVSLVHNPSHLETANPIALGKARARQMHLYDSGTEGQTCSIGDRVLCVQLHGDSAFTGQGVVTETLGLSNLPHFTAGGSVHLIVNNQIGYTTPAMNARSTIYTSDIGKMINCPIIHVNADFPEEVAYATSIALDYRNKFKKDVIIDLIAYRRMGHNELDEPAFTQPIMYKNIRARKSVPILYEERLIDKGVIGSRAEVDEFRQRYFDELDADLNQSYNFQPKWSSMIMPTEAVVQIDTGVDHDTLKYIGTRSVTLPDGFVPHSRLKKFHIDPRIKNIEQSQGLDWATAEALAFGSLLMEGKHVRISGQDVGRGTFSQRHVMMVDQETERTAIPLNKLSDSQGHIEIANSSLSEYAVLGFEYGVSWETPDRLCIWEAQFGDFFNGAQIVIDTCLASGETKWLRQSGLVMLLPHGYDGAGPEHSSCRIERFLQLCDHKYNVLDDSTPDNPNMHVVNVTTPAQYFHVLRRQMARNFRKPLIVAAPKILLRHPAAVSKLHEMEPGTTFQPVLDDPTLPDGQHGEVNKVVFVSGKLYYDLVKERASRGLDKNVSLVRLEELNPFPTAHLKRIVDKYRSTATQWLWVQEEPENQGAFPFVGPRLAQLLPNHILKYHGRKACAAPAVGISSRHKKEQEEVVKGAF
ncbi:thiamine diphosphate-binding protein [Polychytrium aggregatum]|uniref:thiamine diphosphate-binding protein n=1 Tax=Polychytrium aggregatum TaxID=110093 RepID=UPI0022FE0361|nr:thiamine diphosphate-binding protein [Polychytrium aggregatum]KAI9199524.1 thiamine diphosphate-binding protein [Polychytrium aggregatum]